uniref:hypothetical protein n=1 Tax=Exserohilum turcicum TaxID=93612 RepID=UPI002000C42B|nr:hypothetical protein M1I11_mgp050 [Exserohilum turcicum]UOU81431.1 hypothetical protein [Exserohilum turcicum]
MLSILSSKERHIGWSVGVRFEITLHAKDEELLNQIHAYFKGAGLVTKFGVDKVTYRVNNLNQMIDIIIPHFQQYPLNTNKKADFELFSRAVELMSSKEHLTQVGLEKLVAIKASMNLGLSDSLKVAFPLCKPVSRPIYALQPLCPQWVAGFTSGEGYFGVKLLSSNTIKTGKQVRLIFQITQHTPQRPPVPGTGGSWAERGDEFLMKSFMNYFECGKYYSAQRAEYGDLIVIKLSDHINKIIPFFLKNKILGEKSKDFNNWCKVVEIVKTKEHLTEKGLAKIIKIRSSMNKERL